MTATAYGLTLFRFELSINGRSRTCEQWRPDQPSAEAAASRVLADWRETPSDRVVGVAPVPLEEAVERGIVRTPAWIVTALV